MKISQITEGKGFGTDEEYKALNKSVDENWALRAAGKVVFSGAYKKALELLHKEIQADGGKRGRKHDVEYYASRLLRKLRGGDRLDARELAKQYKATLESIEENSVDMKTVTGAKIAGDKLGAKGSGQRMATAMDKVASGQALPQQLAQEIAPFIGQLEKILANPQLRQKFLMLVQQAEKLGESASGKLAIGSKIQGVKDSQVTGEVLGFKTKDGVDKVVFRNDADGKRYATAVENVRVVATESVELEEGVKEMLAKYHKYKDKQMSPVEAQEFRKMVRKLKAAGVDLSEGERHGNDKIYDKCWKGYRKVPGKKRGEPGSCEKIKK